MAQSTPEIHFLGLRPNPVRALPLDPIGGGGGGGGLTAPPKPPSCWLLATLVCNALRALHNALRVLSILCLRYFPAFSFHESCIPGVYSLFPVVIIVCGVSVVCKRLSWSANASGFCSVVCLLLCSSVVVSVGYSDFFLGSMTHLSICQASLFPSESSISLQYFFQFVKCIV